MSQVNRDIRICISYKCSSAECLKLLEESNLWVLGSMWGMWQWELLFIPVAVAVCCTTAEGWRGVQVWCVGCEP